MQTDLYLVAHKVRGEGTIDCALRIRIGEEDGWIIPTSGHRAYPYWHFKLSDLFAYQNIGGAPVGLRDHYEVSAEPKKNNYTDRETLVRREAVPTLEDI